MDTLHLQTHGHTTLTDTSTYRHSHSGCWACQVLEYICTHAFSRDLWWGLCPLTLVPVSGTGPSLDSLCQWWNSEKMADLAPTYIHICILKLNIIKGYSVWQIWYILTISIWTNENLCKKNSPTFSYWGTPLWYLTTDDTSFSIFPRNEIQKGEYNFFLPVSTIFKEANSKFYTSLKYTSSILQV